MYLGPATQRLMALLELSHVDTYYGDSHILFDLSLDVEAGEVVCLLGRNGAGKTTTVRSIIGLTPPRAAAASRCAVTTWPGCRRSASPGSASASCPRTGACSSNLTVQRKPGGGAADVGQRRRQPLDGRARLRAVPASCASWHRQAGGTLSGGEQQMLTIARTLMGNPDVLLLDEPSEGLAPLVVEMLREQLGAAQGAAASP